MVFNPSSHGSAVAIRLIGCWLTGAFFVISVAAYYLLKQKHKEIARSMMKIGLITALIACLLQFVSGDSERQSGSKVPAGEIGRVRRDLYYPRIFADLRSRLGRFGKQEKVYSISIPGGLSFLTYSNFKTPVTGLDQIPRDEWPECALYSSKPTI